LSDGLKTGSRINIPGRILIQVQKNCRVCVPVMMAADLALGKLQAVTLKNLGQGCDSELWAYGSDWL